MPDLIFIVGQTAVGKTETSLQLAESLHCKILSCDSLCFYRGMDIGTAKPSREEQKRVPHFGIDLVPPNQNFSVGDYLQFTQTLIRSLEESNEPLVVVGGSGFYLKSFFEPVVDELHIPESILSMVQRWHREGGLEKWIEKLEDLNQGEPLDIDLQNPRRVGQALTRCLASGKTIQQLKKRFEAIPKPFPRWNKKVILLTRDEEELRQRNHLRVQQMLSMGLIEEVENLLAQGIEQNPSAAKAIGYRETIDFLKGNISRQELAEQIEIHTNQLRRKQRTWFRSQIPIHQELSPEQALQRIRKTSDSLIG